MIEKPQPKPEREPNPVAMLLEAAWASVKAMLEEDSGRWTAAMSSPIAQSSEPARAAASRQVQEEQMAALIHSALEFQIRLALAQRHRSINMAQMGPLLNDLAGFARAVAEGRQVTCRAADCDFKGVATEAGPTCSCPKCGSIVFPDAPPKRILGPNGMALEA